MFVSAERRLMYGRWAVIGLYVVVALVTPLLHHDVACHLQSKSHCDACASHATASRMESIVGLIDQPGRLQLRLPGDVSARVSAERPAPPGRAPPSQSTTL